MAKCSWCGTDYKPKRSGTDPFENHCSEKCKRESKQGSGLGEGFGVQEAAGFAVLIMFLMSVMVGIYNLIRVVAPHVGRESSIAMRKAQIKKLTSIDLHRELVLVGEAVFASQDIAPFSKKYQQHLANIHSIQEEVGSLTAPAESKVVGGVKTATQKKLLERKLRLAKASLGQQAFSDFGTKLNKHIPKIQPLVSRVKTVQAKIKAFEDEIERLRGNS